MKITELQTLRIEEFQNLLWLSVHTDEGVSASARLSSAAHGRGLCP